MDLARTYLGLLCDNYGEGVVEVASESIYAETAGFRGARGVRSWRQRIAKLEELGFISTHQRGPASIGFVAIMNPYVAMARLREKGLVADGWWALYQKRAIEVGALIPGVDADLE